MSEELKPCPFCGGKAMLSQLNAETFSIQCIGINGSQKPEWCGAEVFGTTTAEAIEAWNTRAERTCHIDWGKYWDEPRCTECGYSPCEYPASAKDWVYCPCCGAKVVE